MSRQTGRYRSVIVIHLISDPMAFIRDLAVFPGDPKNVLGTIIINVS